MRSTGEGVSALFVIELESGSSHSGTGLD